MSRGAPIKMKMGEMEMRASRQGCYYNVSWAAQVNKTSSYCQITPRFALIQKNKMI